jgi:hypothetical protein
MSKQSSIGIKENDMIYAKKTGTILVPTMREERSKFDHVFVFAWKVVGGYFEAARVGINTASYITPKHVLVRKRRVRIMATSESV